MANGSSQLRIIIDALWKGKGDASQARKDISGLGQAGKGAAGGLGDAAKQTSALRSAVRTLAGAGALYAAGRAMTGFARDSLQVASSVEETSSLIGTSLGPAAADFEADMGRIADATNRSRFELAEGASTIIAMSRSMGMAQAEAGEFASTMTQAGVDLGSFFNRETSEVFRDIQAALGGSSETMQKYGIDVRETTLKQMALAKGLDVTGATLDRTTRAWLIQESILEQASDAMGDAERTADSYENTMRGLEASTMDLKVALGTALIPTVKDAVTILDAAADQLNTTAQAMSGQHSDAVEGIIEGYRETATSYEELLDVIQRTDETIGTGFMAKFAGALDGLQEGQRESIEQAALMADSYGQFESDMVEIFGSVEGAWEDLKAALGREEAARLYGIDVRSLEDWFEYQRIMQQTGNTANALREELLGLKQVQAGMIPTTEELVDSLKDLGTMTEMEEALLLDVGDATRVYNDLTEEAVEKTDSYWQALDDASGRLRAAEEAQRGANAAWGQDFVAALDGANMGLDDFERLMVESAAAAGAMPALLVEATLATGDYGDEVAEAAVKQAAMIAKADELGRQLAADEISIEGAVEALQNFQTELDRDYTMALDHSAVDEAERRTDSVIEKMQRLDGMEANMTAILSVQQNMAIPDAFMSGGTIGGIPEFHSGTGGRWMRVPGGQDPYPIHLAPNERFNVMTEAQWRSAQGGGGGGRHVNIEGGIQIIMPNAPNNPAAFAKQAAGLIANELNNSMRGG